jgi:hypothetical protein
MKTKMTSTTGMAWSILIFLTAIVLFGTVSCKQGSDSMNAGRSNASLPAPFDPLDLASYGTAKPIEPKGYFAIAIRYVHPPRVEWMENEGVAELSVIAPAGWQGAGCNSRKSITGCSESKVGIKPVPGKLLLPLKDMIQRESVLHSAGYSLST